MENRKDITVPVPADLKEAINEQLSYGDSRAEWIRGAIVARLRAEGVDVDELDIDEIDVEWIEDLEGNSRPPATA